MNHRLLFRKFSDIVFVYLLLLAIFGKSAEIIIPGGELTQDTTWNTPNTTYMIENLSDPLIIPAGKTLTIGAGVKVVSALNNKSTFII